MMRTGAQLRVGIVGFGGAGCAHSSYFSCVPGCVVTKVLDPDPAGLRRAAELCPSATRYATLDGFWADLDVVSICSPDSSHASYLTAALERGVHVLCEKPLTDSIDGIRRIKHAADRASTTVAILHQMRFVPLHRTVKDLIVAGRLGDLSYLEGYYVHDLKERAYRYSQWRHTDNAVPLVYAGCHFADLLRWLANDEVQEVYAMANHRTFQEYPESDLNVALLRFRSGTIGKIATALGAPAPQDHSIRVYGSKAVVENNFLFSGEGGTPEMLRRPALLHRQLLGDANALNRHGLIAQLRRNIPVVALAAAFSLLRKLARRPGAEYGARFYPLRMYEHALACVRAVEDFVAAVRTHRQPLCPVDEAARAVLICLAGAESFRSNRPVCVRPLEEVL